MEFESSQLNNRRGEGLIDAKFSASVISRCRALQRHFSMADSTVVLQSDFENQPRFKVDYVPATALLDRMIQSVSGLGSAVSRFEQVIILGGLLAGTRILDMSPAAASAKDTNQIREELKDLSDELRAAISHKQTVAELVSSDRPGIPPQISAPIKVRPQGMDALAIKDEANPIGALDDRGREGTQSAARHLFYTAVSVLETSGNLQKGFLTPNKAITDELAKPADQIAPIYVGLLNRCILDELQRYEEELPEAAIAAMTQAIQATKVLVSQYAQWRDYEFEERRVLTGQTVPPEAITSIAESVAAALDEAGPKHVDPTITHRLRALLQPVHDGLVGHEAIAAPLLLSLSNIFAGTAELVMSQVHSLTWEVVIGTFAMGILSRFGEQAAEIGLTFAKSFMQFVRKRV